MQLYSKEDRATTARVIDDALNATTEAPAALLARARVLWAEPPRRSVKTLEPPHGSAK